MLNRRECWILSIKTFVYFEYNIEMDLDFHVRVCTSKKRVTGKQPLVEVGVANKRASSALSK